MGHKLFGILPDTIFTGPARWLRDVESSAEKALAPLANKSMEVVDSFARTVGLEPKGKEPALPRGEARGVTYAREPGPLFRGNPSASDVAQGATGDCYFLASLAALAAQRPDLVRNAIHPNPDGTFDVRLYVPRGFSVFEALGPLGTGMEGPLLEGERRLGLAGQLRPITVRVDDRLPVRNGTTRYASTRHGSADWVALYEKAFATVWSSYGAIGNGGTGATALAMLTGGSTESTHLTRTYLEDVLGTRLLPNPFTPAQKEALAAKLTSALAQKKLVVASTYHAQPSAGTPKPLVGSHVYTVLSVDGAPGARTVTLRNPWGENPGSPGDDGIVELPLDTFLQRFEDVSIGTPPASPTAAGASAEVVAAYSPR